MKFAYIDKHQHIWPVRALCRVLNVSFTGYHQHQLRMQKVADIVIQAILRHSDVSVTRQAYIKNDAVDPRSLAAMEALESAVCNQCATESADDKTASAVN